MIIGFGNNVVSALAGDITTVQTDIPVMPGTGAKFAKLLSADFENKSNAQRVYAKITLTDNKESAFEICHLVSVSGDVLNVIRGQEGTTPKGWYLNDVVANFATRGSENHFVQIAQLQSGHYVSGVAGGTANALTLELPATFFVNGGTDWAFRTPLIVFPVQNNTAAATLQLTMGGRVLGNFPLLKGNKSQLVSGDIIKDVPLMCVLDSTKTFFSVLNPLDIYLGSRYLQKDKNGADVPQPDLFVRNIGAARAFSGSVSIGGGGNWTTAEFITWIENQGAFNHPYWMCKGSWSYANNRIITDTGCGNIQLAGAVVEVMGHRGAMTIRVTTATTGEGILGAQFTYINHGEGYLPGWRRDLRRSGDTMDGDLNLPNLYASGVVKSSGEIQTTSANSFRMVYGDYGAFWHQNGTYLYLMLTNRGDPYGSFNELRSLTVNLATGDITMANGATIHGLKVQGNIGIGTNNALGGSSIAVGDNDTGFKQNGDGILDVYVNSAHVFRFIGSLLEGMTSLKINGNSVATGEVQSGNGSARMATDGNLYGSIWGGWLSSYLQNRMGVQDVRLGAQGYYTPGSNVVSWDFGAPSGHALTGISVSETGSNSADNVNGVYYRPIQKLINGIWYNVASA